MGEALKEEKRTIRFFKDQKRATECENYEVIISLNRDVPKYSEILDSQKSQDFEKRSWNICCLKLQSSDPSFYFAYQLESKMFVLLERIKQRGEQSLMGIKWVKNRCCCMGFHSWKGLYLIYIYVQCSVVIDLNNFKDELQISTLLL